MRVRGYGAGCEGGGRLSEDGKGARGPGNGHQPRHRHLDERAFAVLRQCGPPAMDSLVNFGKSTPPQNRQLHISICNSKQQALTIWWGS